MSESDEAIRHSGQMNALAPHEIVDAASSMTEADLLRALESVASTRQDPLRHMALDEIIRYLPEGQLPRVLETLRRANSIEWHWAKALGFVLPRLTVDRQFALIADVLRRLRELDSCRSPKRTTPKKWFRQGEMLPFEMVGGGTDTS